MVFQSVLHIDDNGMMPPVISCQNKQMPPLVTGTHKVHLTCKHVKDQHKALSSLIIIIIRTVTLRRDVEGASTFPPDMVCNMKM